MPLPSSAGYALKRSLPCALPKTSAAHSAPTGLNQAVSSENDNLDNASQSVACLMMEKRKRSYGGRNVYAGT
jgi:hypothetical protein